MIGVLIGGMIGLGVGIVSAMVIGSYRKLEWVGTITASTLIFAAIGWIFALTPDEPQCEAPAVHISTPSIKGCMQPHEMEKLDPEVLKRWPK